MIHCTTDDADSYPRELQAISCSQRAVATLGRSSSDDAKLEILRFAKANLTAMSSVVF